MTKIKITSYKFADIDKHIGLVERDATKLRDKIHSLAICILSEWARDKDQGPVCAEKMTMLQKASPYHSKAFADWVAIKTGMQWAEETEVWYVQKGQKIKKDALDSARLEPFWEVSPPPAAKPLTNEVILKMLQGILDKQQRHEKKPVEGDEFDKSANEHIRAAIKALSGDE